MSAGSRNSSGRDQNEPNKNETARSKIRNNPSINSYYDSGIVTDSNDYAGSLGYHQAGVLNDAFEIDGGSGGGKFKTRPGLTRKRISFKDEVDAKHIAGMSLSEEKAAEPLARMPDDTINPEQHLVPSLSNITKDDPLTTQDGNSGTENTSRENQSTSVLAPSEGKDIRMIAVSLNGKRGRKYGISGNYDITVSFGKRCRKHGRRPTRLRNLKRLTWIPEHLFRLYSL